MDKTEEIVIAALDGRSLLTKALLEDKGVREQAARDAKAYMDFRDDYNSRQTFGEYAFWYFALGFVTCISLQTFLPSIVPYFIELLS